MQLKPTRKHTNLSLVRNALARNSVNHGLRVQAPTAEDYRRRVIEAASAPLTGPIGDIKVARERQERIAGPQHPVRDSEHLPRFDDIMR